MAQFFIDRPIFAGVLSVLIFLAGLLALRVMPISAATAFAISNNATTAAVRSSGGRSKPPVTSIRAPARCGCNDRITRSIRSASARVLARASMVARASAGTK